MGRTHLPTTSSRTKETRHTPNPSLAVTNVGTLSYGQELVGSYSAGLAVGVVAYGLIVLVAGCFAAGCEGCGSL